MPKLYTEPIQGGVKHIICEKTGIGKPQSQGAVLWYKDGTQFRPGSSAKYEQVDDDEILINSLSNMDSGNYTCRVDNGVAHGEHIPFEMNVLCKYNSSSL